MADAAASAAAENHIKSILQGGGWRPGDPTAEALVARSLVNAIPSPFRPPKDVTDLAWDEEGQQRHWLLDDDSLFYHSAPTSVQRGGGGLYDLNISMPILLPGRPEIRVKSCEGENYYLIDPDKDLATHIIFGGGAAAAAADQVVVAPNEPLILKTDDPQLSVVPPAASPPIPSVCDVWATFLHVHLGTVRNVRHDQVAEVASLFKKAMCDATTVSGPTVFDAPIRLNCKGIHRAPNDNLNLPARNLETHAYMVSDDDKNIFRNIRRRIKFFLLLLLKRFSIQQANGFQVNLNSNCRTRPDSFMRIEIRKYGTLTDETLVHGLQLGPGQKGGVLALSHIPVTARAIIQEVRLEMTHARTVDPRWPNQWVLSRRMPGCPEGPKKLPNMARYVFCPSVPMPKVLYEMTSPRQALLESRFGPLYRLHAQNPYTAPTAEESIFDKLLYAGRDENVAALRQLVVDNGINRGATLLANLTRPGWQV